MALFKVFRGSRAELDTISKHDGYAYFCTDDGSFWIDYEKSDGVVERKQVNALEFQNLTGLIEDQEVELKGLINEVAED